MSTDGSGELPFEIREPDGEPTGALILMHGRGVDQYDLLPLLDVLDSERRLLGICPGGPITDLAPGGRHWYVIRSVGFPDPATFAQTYELLGTSLASALDSYGIAWDRTVLGGFSQGAVMALALGLGSSRPRPAGILALSGFIPTVDGWEPSPEQAQGLSAFLSHGAADTIIPVDFARQAKEKLESLGSDLTYRETPMGHAIDPRMLPEIQEWIRERVAAEPRA